MRRFTVGLTSLIACALTFTLLVGCGTGAKPAGGGDTSAPSSASTITSPAEDTPAELPPAPADVSGMSGWFADAYPDAEWVARIKKIEYVPGEVPDSGGFKNAIVVTTDLDFAKEQPVAEEISVALGEAHPAWAKQFVIRFADGNNIQAGDIWDRTP